MADSALVRVPKYRVQTPRQTIGGPCTRRVPHFGVFAVFLHFVVS